MHIVDGALATEVVVAGAALAAAGTAIGLKSLDMERIPQAGVLSAVFFVASLVHVPLGPSSVHLIMNGLAGLVLGWVAFPTLLIALLLQAVFFGFGGLTVLGINALNIALPAVIVWYLCRSGVSNLDPKIAAVWGGIAGALSVALTTVFVAISLAMSGEAFIAAAKLVFIAHLPVMVIEGALCAAAVYLMNRVKPELFGAFGPVAGQRADA